MTKILTIVIPTYNMEAYLKRCLDSLIVSEEQMQSLEVLVINDGSKDKSSEIAHEYETKYPNTFRVIDKENGNYGSCINHGLKEAQGKYIKILDADDWFDTANFEKYLQFLSNVDADLVLTSFSIVQNDTMEASLAYNPALEERKVYDFSQCNLDMVGVYMMHAVTYRIELLRKIDYYQTEGISYTDTEWAYNPLFAVKSVVYTNLDVYQYLLGREGQTMDPKVMLRTINHHEIITRSLIENEHKNTPHGFAKITIERQIDYLLSTVYRSRLVLQDDNSFDNKQMQEFDNYLKEIRPDKYGLVGKYILKPALPIPYVLYWRKFGKRFPVDGIRNLYRYIRYGKKHN